MNIQSWQYLIKRYLDNSITKDELDSLLHQMDEQKDYAGLKTVLQNYWDGAKEKPHHTNINWDKKIDELFAEAKEQEQIKPVKK